MRQIEIKVLHLLRSIPDEVVETLIDALAGDRPANIVCMYGDDVSHRPVNWDRLVEEIFRHDKIICW